MAAAEVGVAGSRAEIVTRAADAVLAADSSPSHRVRVRIALIDLSDQAIAEMDETFAAAVEDAGGDPALMAPLMFRLAWQALIDGNPVRAEAEVDKAVCLANSVGDATTEAMALALKAQLARVLGRRDYMDSLNAALALPQPDGWLHMTPRFLADRFAILDDRLEEARADLFRMLALVERGGGEELVSVLRSLSEVSVQAGRCRDALEFARRGRCRSPRRPGSAPDRPGTAPRWPSWPGAASPGPPRTRSAAGARRSRSATRSTLDATCTRWARCGCAPATPAAGWTRCAGSATWSRPRAWSSRWCCAGTAISPRAWSRSASWARPRTRSPAARSAIVEPHPQHRRGRPARPGRGAAAGRTGRRRVGGGAAGRGDPPVRPARPADREGAHAAGAGQVERRRRRYAAARAAVGEALAVFTRIGAKPWAEQAARTLARVDGSPAEGSATYRDRPDMNGSSPGRWPPCR